ncbi:MAG: hypothetical protein ACI837_001006, partial [Crocinitomicaceae bacterium]
AWSVRLHLVSWFLSAFPLRACLRESKTHSTRLCSAVVFPRYTGGKRLSTVVTSTTFVNSVVFCSSPLFLLAFWLGVSLPPSTSFRGAVHFFTCSRLAVYLSFTLFRLSLCEHLQWVAQFYVSKGFHGF